MRLLLFLTFVALSASAFAATPLDRLQKDCFDYFWTGGDGRTGMAYEASFTYPHEGRPLAVGGTGFGIAAVPAAVERGWVSRSEAVERLGRIVRFLRDDTQRGELHGAFPHWLHSETGRAIRFSDADDGADLVETALLMQGLLIARSYFDRDGEEQELRAGITELWEDVEWDWFANDAEDGLFWHWSPNNGFKLGLKIQGYNESFIAYILALGSPTHSITRKTYDHWTAGNGYETRDVFGYQVPATVPGGGPLFLIHYSFIGLDPTRMADRFVPEGYYVRNVRQALSNRGYCLYVASSANKYHPGYWGLTASLAPAGYAAHDPLHDTGTIAPTAALASMPYVPAYAMDVLQFLEERKADYWGEYGPYDAVNIRDDWVGREYLAIDQLPIVGMIENYRTGLLWRLFMATPEIQAGLAKAGIHEPRLREGFPECVETLVLRGDEWVPDGYAAAVHPDAGAYSIPYWLNEAGAVEFTLRDAAGLPSIVWSTDGAAGRNRFTLPLLVSSEKRAVLELATAGGQRYQLPVVLRER